LFNSDIEEKQYDKKKLKEDLMIFKGIVTDMHAGVYAYNTAKEINNLFDSINNSIDGPLVLRAFYNKVDYIVDRLKCVHSEVYFPDIFFDSINNRSLFFPTKLTLIDNRLIVNSDNQNIPLGAEVLNINGISSTSIIDNIKRYKHVDGNSEHAKGVAINDEFAYNFYLSYGGCKEFAIEYMKDSSKTIELKRFYGEKLSSLYSEDAYLPSYYIPTDVNYDLIMDYKTKTAVMYLSTFSFKTTNAYNSFLHFLSNSFSLIKNSGFSNLIIDCRENGGGYYDATFSALSYLVNEPIQEFDSAFQRFKKLSYTQYLAIEDTSKIIENDTAYFTYKKINSHLYKLNNDEISKWYPQETLYKGKIFVLINNNVASAASTFVSVLKDKTNAILIGEETGGSYSSHNSSIINFVLPNSLLKVAIPLRRYFQPVKTITKNTGIVPDKEIHVSVSDLINTVDPQMTYIFDSLIKK
jgi:Peptidase family S41